MSTGHHLWEFVSHKAYIYSEYVEQIIVVKSAYFVFRLTVTCF